MQKYQTFLNSAIHLQTKSVQSYEIDGLKVWLKKASKRHPWWIYLPLHWISALLNIRILIPVPNLGGANAIHCEAARIRQLEQLNIPVPKVLAESNQGLLIQDIAHGDEQLMQLDHALARQPNFEKRQILFADAIHAIKSVHEKNAYLSEAFARNILVDSHNNMFFIDFETDPGKTLDIHTCQARDWLCFIFSTAFRFNEQERPHIELMIRTALHDRPEILQQLVNVGRRFGWLNNIGIEKVGNDGKRMKIFLFFLKNLTPQQHCNKGMS
ncbi:MAG: hypothetical protein QM666_06110 [Acinetobacter sp.]